MPDVLRRAACDRPGADDGYTSRFAVADARSNASACVGLKSGSCPVIRSKLQTIARLGDIAVEGDVVARHEKQAAKVAVEKRDLPENSRSLVSGFVMMRASFGFQSIGPRRSYPTESATCATSVQNRLAPLLFLRVFEVIFLRATPVRAARTRRGRTRSCRCSVAPPDTQIGQVSYAVRVASVSTSASHRARSAGSRKFTMRVANSAPSPEGRFSLVGRFGMSTPPVYIPGAASYQACR